MLLNLFNFQFFKRINLRSMNKVINQKNIFKNILIMK